MRFSSPKIIVIIISFAFCFVGDARTRADLVPEDTLLIDLVTGRVVIEMFPAVALGYVARIRELARGRSLRRGCFSSGDRWFYGPDGRCEIRKFEK